MHIIGQEGDDQIPGMKRALLEIIATGVASTRADVERYANCTYLKTCLATRKDFNPDVAIQNTIQFLVENEFVRVKMNGENGKVCKMFYEMLNPYFDAPFSYTLIYFLSVFHQII